MDHRFVAATRRESVRPTRVDTSGGIKVRRMTLADGPEATERAGGELAEQLRPGDVVLVSGELGAGKTTFVRGAVRALGVDGPVTSPTFVVGHAYEGTAGPVAHLDLYRLAGMGAEDPGLLDPFFPPDAIVFVEWPEHGPGAWPEERVARRVRLSHAGGDRRRIEVEP
jgi:tRNA threonylcarbamoyladenosine biosynthesis protein TsaE